MVFNTAPADGAEIVIYRRTKIWQPENYRAFGRFHSEKTELSVDRATLIAQERYGDATGSEPPNGIVGGANLSIERGEFDVTLVSERGTDAIIPMYDDGGTAPTPPGDPDPTIAIWEGVQIFSGIYSDQSVAATIRFRMDLTGGDTTKASAYWPNYNEFAFTSWCTVDPSDNEYWMRVTIQAPGLTSARYLISDGIAQRESGEAFQIRGNEVVPVDAIADRVDATILTRDGQSILPRGVVVPPQGVYGPYVSVYTFGDTAPAVRDATFLIEICKDDGSGVPDQAWAQRYVTLEAKFNSNEPDPIDTTGSVTWDSFFGAPFALGVFYGNIQRQIPPEGIAINFTWPDTATLGKLKLSTFEVPHNPGRRFGAVNTGVLDFTTTPAQFTWGLGGGITATINYSAGVGDSYIECLPGETSIFSLKTESAREESLNWVTVQASTL